MTRLPDTPAPVDAPTLLPPATPVATPIPSPAAPGTTLGGDAGTLVQAYGAVALINGFQPQTAIYTAQAQPLVPSVEPVLPAGFRRIDTYA